jgi:hypothetical protein
LFNLTSGDISRVVVSEPLEKSLASWNNNQMRISKLLIMPLLVLTTSCSSSGNNEAVKAAFSSGCTLVTSSYDTWAATGQSTATETGQLGRENLETSFNTALSSLSEFVSQGELEDAKNSTDEGSSQEVTGPQIYLLIKEVQSDMRNWEAVVQYPNWTPGKMATFDGGMDSLKKSCDTYRKSS